MRTPLAVLVAVATACTVAAGSTVPAQALGGLPEPTVSPLPTVSVPGVPEVPEVPGVTVPTPVDPLPGGGAPGIPTLPDAGDDTGGQGGAGAGSPIGSATTPASSDATDAASPKAAALAADRRRRLADAATPMVAGTAAARDLLDDESSPELRAASDDFLAADQAIAEIARLRRLMADLRLTATEMALTYRAIGVDVTTARGASESLHGRYDEVHAHWAAGTRDAYLTGLASTDDGTASSIVAAMTRLSDGGARADLRMGWLVVHRAQARADAERVIARYNEIKHALEGSDTRLGAFAARRSVALQAVQSAKGSDVALNQARLVESGRLGAQIRDASATLERSGSTVQGTGDLARPLDGHVTSPFGMRVHPILNHTKLHTGTDLAGGSTILAADDGRVIMTVTSTAYGNFTVIDHGVVDGRRITTAYAHQATFLVREGEAVRKGDPIGVVGSTGYSTGPHLHFEVREDGTVVDPMTRLAG